MLRQAITRAVGELAGGERSFVPRLAIDAELAAQQHAGYLAALRTLGCAVIELAAAPGLADAVFVEDTALVFDELAVLTRPGARSRRPEVDTVAPALQRWRPLQRLRAPATLDGGDVLRLGREVYVGASARSNAEAVSQLRTLLAPFGYRVQRVPMRDCLHLKSAVTQVTDDTLLLQPRWVDPGVFPGWRLIEVAAEEEHAANVLRIGDGLIYPSSFPRTAERLRAVGGRLLTVDVSELQKAEGAVTCCSLIIEPG